MKRILAYIFAIMLAAACYAQDVIVTLTPMQQVLPPQVLLYLSQPNAYFNVMLMNTSNEPKQVYLGMSLQQMAPDMSISVRIGARQQPEAPFVIPANGTYQLTMVDMKKMFDHVPASDVQATPGLFDNYSSGAFGLLPEGDYEAQMVAYQWNPNLKTPVAVSNPNGGKCTFTICYKAQAPQFLTPMVSNSFDLEQVAELDPVMPQFTWTAPIINCNPLAANFQYSIKIVELLSTQTADKALAANAAVYQSPSPLVSPMCLLPQTVVSKLDPNITYVAQITASTTNLQSSYLNFAMIENDGKSAYRLFKVKSDKKPEAEEKKEEKPDGDSGDGDELEIWLEGKSEWQVDSTKLYTFRNPAITAPLFCEGEKRKTYTYNQVPLAWRAAWFVGGVATQPDTLKIDYKVNLYQADHLIEQYADIEEYCKNNKPIYEKEVSGLNDTIAYDKIADKVKAGDYLYLRIDPVCQNEKSIAYVDSVCNRTNWALVELPTKKYFQCSNTVIIDDYEPTTKKASDLKGKVVSLGEYNLTLDEIEEIKGLKRFKGKGHIEWRPLGYKVMVCVEFDSLGINQDGVVFDGQAKTYQRPEVKEVTASVDDIFSDLGINDWASDLGLPYGGTVSALTVDGAKKVAEKVDISKYYEYIKTGKGYLDELRAGEIEDLYFPVKMPKSINTSPIDIQIYDATFAPQWAKINIIGEFTLPESKYLKDNILLLAAPRLCISPDRMLPESGTVALMKDFTVKDPKSDFEFTFKAPDDLQEPTAGCFVSWKDDKFELLDLQVTMVVPDVYKIDEKGNKTEENPIIDLRTRIESWDNWHAKGTMDPFVSEDLEGWIFQPGAIIYDHSTEYSVEGFSGLPKEYDRVKAGMPTASSPDEAWQGLYISQVGVVFPKMLKVSDESKNWEGHLKLMAKDIIIDGSGITFDFGMENVFSLETGSLGGWGLSMDNVKLNVLQNKFTHSWFDGDIKTPLDGTIRYKCDMIAQGKAEGRAEGDEGYAFIFTTQQIDGLKFDFWLGEMDFDKDQTYFLIEAETHKTQEDEVRVELSIGGNLSITIGRNTAVGAAIYTFIPDIHVAGLRLANCKRWQSKYFKNLYDLNQLGELASNETLLNEKWGFKEEYNCGADDDKGSFYFSMGRWSIASAQKQLGPFNLSLTDIDLNMDGDKLGLEFTGGIGICDVLKASVGLAIVSKVDLKNFSFAFDGVEFRKATFETGFGGLSVKGELEVSTGEDEGYAGKLAINLPGDFFKLAATGGFYKATDSDGKKYSWGYLTAEIEGEFLRLDPIVISGISGGFYFNCKPSAGYVPANGTDERPVKSKGLIGFMIGMTICTSAGEETLNSKMSLTVVYDTAKNRLSTFLLNGTLNAVGGIINAKAQLLYKDDDESRLFNLNITAGGSGALDSSTKQMLMAFTGNAVQVGQIVQSGLGDLTNDDSVSDRTDSSVSKTNKNEFTAKCGFSVSVDFKIEHFKTGKTAGKTKWHLYIGEPPYDKRCQLTLIDFQVGKKSDRFAAWAYMSSNMYFCLGNELPDNGKLPDIPQKAKDFLDGNDVNGNKQGLSASAKSVAETNAQSMMKMVNDQGCEGGIMVGACAGDELGINAGIVYAHSYSCYGFDVMLKKLADGTECRGGGKMGYHGWYGMGQAYIVLLGDLGIHIDLWFVKKDVSIIDVGVGAMVQAGLPNPIWCYGKARARLSLLGGLFKFNRSIEFKAGKVCKPDYGDPLDNITIVVDAQPGDTLKANGYSEPVSAYAKPRFTTNFVIGKEVTLVDLNQQADAVEKYSIADEKAATLAERTYRFIIKSVNIYKSNGSLYANCSWSAADEGTNFNVDCTSFQPNSKYYMKIVAEAQEWNNVTESWDLPLIKGKRTKKEETSLYYFLTGPLSEDVNDEIVYAMPNAGTWDEMRLYDLRRPYICLAHQRADLAPAGVNTDDSSYDGVEVDWAYRWVLYRNGKRYATRNNYVERTSGDGYKYETWRPASNFTFPDNTSNYSVSLVKYAKGAKANTINTHRLVSDKRSVFVKSNGEYTYTEDSSTTTTSSSGLGLVRKGGTLQSLGSSTTASSTTNAKENYAKAMKEFFDQEEKEADIDRTIRTDVAGGYVDKVAIAANEEAVFTISAKSLVDKSFGVDTKTYGYEDVYMAVASFTNSNLFKTKSLDADVLANTSAPYFNSPYTLWTYYSEHAFLGGKYFGKYAFGKLEMNVQGLNMTLQYPAVRQDGKNYVNGLFHDLEQNSYSMFFSAYYWPHKMANGLGALQPSENWTNFRYYKSGYKWHYWQDKLAFTYLHQDVCKALISDAVTTQKMVKAISDDAYSITKMMNDRMLAISGDVYNKIADLKKSVTAWNDGTFHTSRTCKGPTNWYLASNNTNVAPNLAYSTFTYSVPWKHYWLMACMAKDRPFPGYSVEPMQNVKDFYNSNATQQILRYRDARNVWFKVKDRQFSAKDFLKAFTRITYAIWRTDRYNIITGNEECQDKSFVKYQSVENPFAYYNFE